MKGAERRAGGDIRGERRVAKLRRKETAKPRHRRPRVDHAAQKRHHPLAPNARQVVADAHVEERAAVDAEEVRQEIDQHRRLDVLLQRLIDGQLLRPLHVVAYRARVDAGSGDDDRIENLHGLQLHHPRAGQPRQDDVLRQLGVRAGRGAERRGSAAAVDLHRRVREDERPQR